MATKESIARLAQMLASLGGDRREGDKLRWMKEKFAQEQGLERGKMDETKRYHNVLQDYYTQQGQTDQDRLRQQEKWKKADLLKSLLQLEEEKSQQGMVQGRHLDDQYLKEREFNQKEQMFPFQVELEKARTAKLMAEAQPPMDPNAMKKQFEEVNPGVNPLIRLDAQGRPFATALQPSLTEVMGELEKIKYQNKIGKEVDDEAWDRAVQLEKLAVDRQFLSPGKAKAEDIYPLILKQMKKARGVTSNQGTGVLSPERRKELDEKYPVVRR